MAEKRVNIWMNHWFSTAYNIIDLIKKDEALDFNIIGTNENDVSVLMCACDEWYSEPDKVSDSEYVDFCIDFCEKHDIEVFLPHRHMLTISKYKERFDSIGTKVIVEDYEKMQLLNHKEQAYDFVKKNAVASVPSYYVVTTISEFEEAYNSILEQYGNVCTKFVKDEGGKSYRLIDNTRQGYEALFKKQNTRMTYDALHDALSQSKNGVFSPLMVMPFLKDEEISVDCLKTPSGNIMVPRVKSYSRFEEVRYDDDILEMCDSLLNLLDLENPCNIQFKYLDGIPYFLEVNTRMSGGVHMSCLASGVNIPNIAVNKILGINKEWNIDKRNKKVSQVEIPLVIETSSI